MSNPPASKAATNSSASRFDSSGTSRMAGATIGRPPYVVIKRASSSARRLSRVSTRNPSKLPFGIKPSASIIAVPPAC